MADLYTGCDIAVAVLGNRRVVVGAELADPCCVAVAMLVSPGGVVDAVLANHAKVAIAVLLAGGLVVNAVLKDADIIANPELSTAGSVAETELFRLTELAIAGKDEKARRAARVVPIRMLLRILVSNVWAACNRRLTMTLV